MDMSGLPGYKLAIAAKYDDVFSALSPDDARARALALAPFHARVIVALDLPEDGRHLDVGCGDGSLALEIARARPQMQVVGIDSSEKAIALAEGMARGVQNLTFHVSDATAPPQAKYSRILAASVFNLVPDKVAALRTWRSMAARDARLVIADGFATGGAGTMGVGATSADALGLEARRAGWTLVHREDLTPLVKKLNDAHVWPWPEYLRDGIRYSLVTLRAQ